MNKFRIHGDNIVECERIANIIIGTLDIKNITSKLVSPSTVVLFIKANYKNIELDWEMELLPGFNKSRRNRWEGNIFAPLREAGSFIDETPDVIISAIDENDCEMILLAIEFCSALQAGNQAWQRNGRALSTGRTGCPYIYIVDFVKYELDNSTRERKNLRFPNAAVPYSYINFAKNTGNFIAQLYVKSEEFNKVKDSALAGFDENDFGNNDLGDYIVKLLLKLDTQPEEESILNKNMNVVQFLAKNSNANSNYTEQEWKDIYELDEEDIVDYATKNARFNFHKTIAASSHHGQSKEFVKIVDELSVGLASRDLPFGIIPSTKRKIFANKIHSLYPKVDNQIIESIGDGSKHLIVAVFKGFKPRGDDNRPDRGLLPLVTMLSASDVDIMSFVFGPLVEHNLNLLDSNPLQLANNNGLWRVILGLSNYLILDVPVLASPNYDAVRFVDTSFIKEHYTCNAKSKKILAKPCFASIPITYGEDDVDTGIHYLFTHILKDVCFEGMCNPPGGDWSGFSIIKGSSENRWLSLPRVSDVVNGKRPDHIIEIFDVFEKPLLLSIESKEKSIDLEEDVGTKLIAYIQNIMNYIPSATREIKPSVADWQWGIEKVDINSFEIMSAAAYLKAYAESPNVVLQKNCEILFVMDPIRTDEFVGWEVEIVTSSEKSNTLKSFIISTYGDTSDNQFRFK